MTTQTDICRNELKTMLREKALIILPNHPIVQKLKVNLDLIDDLPDYIVNAILRGFKFIEED